MYGSHAMRQTGFPWVDGLLMDPRDLGRHMHDSPLFVFPHFLFVYSFSLLFLFIYFLSFLLFGFHPPELSFFFFFALSHFCLVLSQVRGSFLSPSFLLSLMAMCLHMVHVSHAMRHPIHHMCPSPKVPCGILMWHHSMCHSIPGASKNVKFRLSRNPTKFDWVTRFMRGIQR